MLEPVKTAFGKFLKKFFDQVVPTTKPMNAFVEKPFGEAFLLAPSRMIDQAEEMFEKYLRVDFTEKPTRPHFLPVVLAAVAKDYTPTGRDYTRQIADPHYVMIPNDPKERIFQLRTIAADVRAQVAIFASDTPTAQSIAAQFLLFLDETFNRRFVSCYQFAGLDTFWPVQIEAPDSPAMSVQTEAKNLTILAIDLTLKVEAPLFGAPKVGEPNDGKGTPGTNDPAGYPAVKAANLAGYAGLENPEKQKKTSEQLSDRKVNV